jgi:hypothetical protein
VKNVSMLTRRADPERIFRARRAAVRPTLMDTGIDEATADLWCDAWEIEAAGHGLARDSAYLAARRGVDRRGAER